MPELIFGELEALKQGYEYTGVADESEKFLRRNVFSKFDTVVLFVDLVGSTTMTLELPEDKLAIIMSSFAQEMASVITLHNGYVLKFVGDAVIGYFVASKNPLLAADNAVSFAKSMLTIIQKGINPILNQYDYPDLMVKIGVDFELAHGGFGVVIHPNTTIGNRVKVYPGVTLGRADIFRSATQSKFKGIIVEDDARRLFL